MPIEESFRRGLQLSSLGTPAYREIDRHYDREDLPTRVEDLADSPSRRDRAGSFRGRPGGVPVLAEGRHRGRTAAEVARLEPDYLRSHSGPARNDDVEMIIVAVLVVLTATLGALADPATRLLAAGLRPARPP